MYALIKELVIRQVEHRSETHSNESQHLAEGTEGARLRRRFSFVLQQAFSFYTRHRLCRQWVALASTRQLYSQGPVSVHAHRTDGVTESKGREGANGVEGEIGVGVGSGDENRVGGGNGNGDEDGDGAGAETATAAGVKRTKERKMGTGTGAETGWERGRERERGRGRGWRPGDEHRMGTGTGAGMEMRAVAKMGTGTTMRTGTGTGMGSERAEERRRIARDRTRILDAVSLFHCSRVIISADRG